ncbi:YpoC family protein [Bacillus sp. FJAT-49736]|uniref:YpoC family protein n=1 Tax=Bacillus sp. FJAT-49736 TaxID=2833582 RepID=UPI001BC96013|nr:hypothetical protein [Bacillus sp. FJAT-49736]MBS4173241.1 hypothetical protein [Bacillus sp. FJAT-49736]
MNIAVPKELRHPLFFPQENILISENKHDYTHQLFLPELLFYNQISNESPWLKPEISVPVLSDKWNTLREELSSIVKGRNKDTGSKMLEGISLFLSLLFWSNNNPVHLYDWEKQVKLFAIKPYNCKERLHFILANYRNYSAFIQLSELFLEQQKHFAKKIVMEKYKQK